MGHDWDENRNIALLEMYVGQFGAVLVVLWVRLAHKAQQGAHLWYAKLPFAEPGDPFGQALVIIQGKADSRDICC